MICLVCALVHFIVADSSSVFTSKSWFAVYFLACSLVNHALMLDSLCFMRNHFYGSCSRTPEKWRTGNDKTQTGASIRRFGNRLSGHSPDCVGLMT